MNKYFSCTLWAINIKKIKLNKTKVIVPEKDIKKLDY